MKRTTTIIATIMVVVTATVAFSGSLFTDVSSHYPPEMVTQINTAFDAVEDSIDGTTPQASPVVQGTLTAISTNSATTNIVITVDGVLDGETLGDDTVDDDAIDFSDVTGADLTLTDCTAVTASGAVYGGTVGFSAAVGYFAIYDTTQLVFIASSGSVTNVIDVDIATE